MAREWWSHSWNSHRGTRHWGIKTGEKYRESEPCNLLKIMPCLRQRFCGHSLSRRRIILWSLPGPGSTAQDCSRWFISLLQLQPAWNLQPTEDWYRPEDKAWIGTLSMLWWSQVPSCRICGHEGRNILGSLCSESFSPPFPTSSALGKTPATGDVFWPHIIICSRRARVCSLMLPTTQTIRISHSAQNSPNDAATLHPWVEPYGFPRKITKLNWSLTPLLGVWLL